MPNSDPEVPLFKRFQTQWKNIDITNFTVRIADSRVKEAIVNQIEAINLFGNETMKWKHPRADYKELLYLTNTFIDKVSPEEVKFKCPGALHHAR